MATTSEYLKQLNEDKKALVDNLNSLGVQADYSQTFTSLVPKINESGLAKPSGTIELNENGEHNVAQYEKALVNVASIKPILQERTITPTESKQNVFPDSEYNGLSKVVVEPIPSDYVKPTGTLLVDENGSYDVKNYSNVEVEVESSGGSEQTYFSTLNKTGNTSRGGILASIYTVPNDLVITTGRYQFLYCTGLVKAPKLDYSNLTNCSQMFYYCGSLSDVTGLVNFKKITHADSMFDSCSKITQLDLTSWDPTNLTTTRSMFNYCSNLVEVDISNWVSSKITTMYGMFSYCEKLNNVISTNTNITSCKTFESMFNYCESLTSIDLSWLHYSKSMTTYRMFNYCSALQHIDIRNLDITKSTSYSQMFNQVPTTCEIIVMNDACKTWMNEKFPTMTNVKTVAELGE